jgi:hypothetical protein
VRRHAIGAFASAAIVDIQLRTVGPEFVEMQVSQPALLVV